MSTFYESEDGIRVAVNNEYAFATDSVDITLARRLPNGEVMIMRRNAETSYIVEWETVPIGTAVTGPTIRIPTEFARALLDALLRHYQGASDMHQLRQDFLHERSRVDKLIQHTMDVSFNLVEQREGAA